MRSPRLRTRRPLPTSPPRCAPFSPSAHIDPAGSGALYRQQREMSDEHHHPDRCGRRGSIDSAPTADAEPCVSPSVTTAATRTSTRTSPTTRSSWRRCAQPLVRLVDEVRAAFARTAGTGRQIMYRVSDRQLPVVSIDCPGRLSDPSYSNLLELELELGRERSAAAREARRARGQHIGRPKALDESKSALAQRMQRKWWLGEPDRGKR
jgi:hypothetical protein